MKNISKISEKKDKFIQELKEENKKIDTLASQNEEI